MVNPAEIFGMGGMLAMFAFVFGVAGGLLATIGTLFIGLRKLRWPASATWLLMTLAVIVGAFGAWQGANAAQITGSAAPEVIQTLIAMGISQAMYSEMGTLMLLGLAFLVASSAAAVPGPIVPGDNAKADIVSIGGAVGGGVLGTVLAAGGILMTDIEVWWMGLAMFVLPFVTMVGLINIVVSSLRISADDPKQQARVVGLRGLTMTAALVAVVVTGHLFSSMGEIAAFRAVAVAAPEQKQAMLVAGIEVANWARVTSWFATLPILFAGLGSILPKLAKADGRVAMGFGIATTQVIIIALGLGFMRMSINGTFGMLAGSIAP